MVHQKMTIEYLEAIMVQTWTLAECICECGSLWEPLGAAGSLWEPLGASGSVRKLSNQNPKVVKFHSVLHRCGGLQVHLGAPVTNLGGHRRTGGDPGSTWEH